MQDPQLGVLIKSIRLPSSIIWTKLNWMSSLELRRAQLEMSDFIHFIKPSTMKRTSLFLPMMFFISCISTRPKSYYYVDPIKEQEILIKFNKDSTFLLFDTTGCNQFKYSGRYRWFSRNKIETGFSFQNVQLILPIDNANKENLFPLKELDTAWLIYDERIVIEHCAFKIGAPTTKKLKKIRVMDLEKMYIDKLGKKMFITLLGNGKGIKEAEKNLEKCSLPDVPYKLSQDK